MSECVTSVPIQSKALSGRRHCVISPRKWQSLGRFFVKFHYSNIDALLHRFAVSCADHPWKSNI